MSDQEELRLMARTFDHKVKMEPLKQWVCDTCGEIINDVKEGWLEWFTDKDGKKSGFRIVHYLRGCQYNDQVLFHEGKILGDMPLKDFIGPNGLSYLLVMLDMYELRDRKEVIEIIRRLHVDYYEEARQYWDLAEQDYFFADANEVWPYLPRTCLQIIINYAKSTE